MWSTGTWKARQQHSSRSIGNEAGFTLIELVIVMTIMAVVTLAAVPAWQQFNRTMMLRGAALQFASLLRYAQLSAVESGEERQVLVEPDTGAYQLLPLASATGNGDTSEDADSVDTNAGHATNQWEIRRVLPKSVQLAVLDDQNSAGGAYSGNAENGSDAANPDQPAEAAGSVTAAFLPDGTATPITFAVSGATNLMYQISVSHVSGTVQVVKTSRE